MLARKETVVKQNNDGILYLFKKNKVAFFHGRGSFARRGDGGWRDRGRRREARDAHRASTSSSRPARAPRALPGTPFDEKTMLSNDGALAIGAVPKTLGVVGSGVIGLEMGSVWRRLGAEVTVLEALPAFLGAVDSRSRRKRTRRSRSQGLKIELGVKISERRRAARTASASPTPTPPASAQTLACDKLIVSIGRVPNTTASTPRRSA